MFFVFALLFSGIEYATDYVDVLEGAPFAVLADGHDVDDGSAPDERPADCDRCCFGGVHLTAFLALPPVPMSAVSVVPSLWRAPVPALRVLAPPYRPPIA